jgi:hypothetical protein
MLQIAKLKEFCRKANVEFDIKKGKHVKQILLRGEGGDVSSAFDEITSLMMAIEKENQKRNEEELISKQVYSIH